MKYLPLLCCSFLLACSSNSTSNPGTTGADPGADAGADDTVEAPSDTGTADAGDDAGPTDDVESDATEPGTLDPSVFTILEAGPFEVPAGQEKFLCYSFRLEEDISVSEIAVDAKPVLHHVVFSRTSSDDPEGVWECDVLFQNNWLPVFISGTGDASVTMPEGAGHVLPAGTQLTMQLHLLNATLEDVTETIPIGLKGAETTDVEPVSTMIFGTTSIALAANQPGTVESGCRANKDVHLFAGFAHMHYLGRKMIVSVGPDEDNLTEVFRSDPYDFDYQEMVGVDLTIKKDDFVRVTCEYDNTLDQLVTFGESSTSEMCFFIGFGTGAGDGLNGCIGGGSSGGFLPEACGTDPANDIGLGAKCSKNGGECQGGLLCTEDLDQVAGPEVCIGIGCSQQSDCGEGGVCCKVNAAGNELSVCVPPSCVFAGCNIQE